MRAFDCPYLVAFIGVAVEDDCVMLVTEYMDGGDLFQGLHGPRRADFAWHTKYAAGDSVPRVVNPMQGMHCVAHKCGCIRN